MKGKNEKYGKIFFIFNKPCLHGPKYIHFFYICFMERLLQINKIGIHRRVLSSTKARVVFASWSFYIFFYLIVPFIPCRPTFRLFCFLIFYFYSSLSLLLSSITFFFKTIIITVIYIYFFLSLLFRGFMKFFWWCPALFHSLSLLYI